MGVDKVVVLCVRCSGCVSVAWLCNYRVGWPWRGVVVVKLQVVFLAMLLLITAPAVVAFELMEGVSVRFLSGKESGEFLAQPDDSDHIAV